MEEKPPEALLCVGDDGGVDVADVRGGVGVVDRRRHQVAAGRVAGERKTSDNMRLRSAARLSFMPTTKFCDLLARGGIFIRFSSKPCIPI